MENFICVFTYKQYLQFTICTKNIYKLLHIDFQQLLVFAEEKSSICKKHFCAVRARVCGKINIYSMYGAECVYTVYRFLIKGLSVGWYLHLNIWRAAAALAPMDRVLVSVSRQSVRSKTFLLVWNVLNISSARYNNRYGIWWSAEFIEWKMRVFIFGQTKKFQTWAPSTCRLYILPVSI